MAVVETAQVLEGNRAYYLKRAESYDRGRESFFANDRRRLQTDLDWIESRRPLAAMSIVDMGCGTGFFTQALAERGGRRFHCVDLNDTFLELTRLKLRAVAPDVQAICHRTDFATFVRERAALLEEVDLIVMGSVLQYVAGHQELLRDLARGHRRICFYITGTHLSARCLRHSLLEGLLAAADYRLHRWWHRQPRASRQADGQIRVEVHAQELALLFEDLGYETRCYRYTTLHTRLMDSLHRTLRGLLPSAGSYFTLIARQSARPGE